MPVSGEEMFTFNQKAGWVVVQRKGSHVKVREGDLRAMVPLHKELKRGLGRALFKRLEQSRADKEF